MVIASWLLVEKVINGIDLFAQHGPLIVFGMILFLAGVQLISAGLIGELVSRIYFESQGKPTYTIERVITGKSSAGMR